MKLDYIANINEYGDHVVRLYDFNQELAIKFRAVVMEAIITNKKELDLSAVDFIESRNCRLTLRISEENTGIFTNDNELFFCDLTTAGYEQMINLLEPFCNRDTKGYQWLYDIDTQTDFLFSPGGTW